MWFCRFRFYVARKSVVSLSVNKNQDRIHTHYLSDVDSVDSGHAKTAACCFAEQLIFMLCPSPGSDAELHAMRACELLPTAENISIMESRFPKSDV